MAGDGGDRPRVIQARPTLTVNGREQPTLAEGLLGLRISETADGLFDCEASFGNWGAKDDQVTFLYFDRRLLDFGKQLTVGVGGSPLFQGRITGLEAQFPEGGTPRLAVLAEDRHQDLRMARRTRTFSDVTDEQVFQQVAGDHGLTPDVRLPGPNHRVLAQLNQSDLAFLRERARTVDAELWMAGTTLLARPRSDRQGASLRLGYGNELRDFSVLADVATQRSRVVVGGWDVAGKQALRETAGDASTRGELNGGQGGSAVLAATLGERVESVVQAVPLDSREAQARAEALYKRIARRFLTGRGVAETSAGLRVGAKLRLEQLGELFSGEYYVTEVVHRFDGELGLRTEFTVERAGLGGAAA
jgi:phage protein D